MDWFTFGVFSQWGGLFRRTNSTEFTVVMCDCELDRFTGCLDVRVGFLGLGFCLSVAIMPPSRELLDALKNVSEENIPWEEIKKSL